MAIRYQITPFLFAANIFFFLSFDFYSIVHEERKNNVKADNSELGPDHLT